MTSYDSQLKNWAQAGKMPASNPGLTLTAWRAILLSQHTPNNTSATMFGKNILMYHIRKAILL